MAMESRPAGGARVLHAEVCPVPEAWQLPFGNLAAAFGTRRRTLRQ